ncbi:hypothetical protein TRIP_B350463 [uncultured Desulfatiglans sp.]|nr:hypothetical protein TRIP_B350463 [uncultured Desulfatiglans sp.]
MRLFGKSVNRAFFSRMAFPGSDQFEDRGEHQRDLLGEEACRGLRERGCLTDRPKGRRIEVGVPRGLHNLEVLDIPVEGDHKFHFHAALDLHRLGGFGVFLLPFDFEPNEFEIGGVAVEFERRLFNDRRGPSIDTDGRRTRHPGNRDTLDQAVRRLGVHGLHLHRCDGGDGPLLDRRPLQIPGFGRRGSETGAGDVAGDRLGDVLDGQFDVLEHARSVNAGDMEKKDGMNPEGNQDEASQEPIGLLLFPDRGYRVRHRPIFRDPFPWQGRVCLPPPPWRCP